MTPPDSNPEQPAEKDRLMGLIKILIFVLLLAFAWISVVPHLVSGGPTKTSRIISNLRQIDSTKNHWMENHGITSSVQMTEMKEIELSSYISRNLIGQDLNAWLRPVAGERYVINPSDVPPEAHLTHKLKGMPKGTIIRLTKAGHRYELVRPVDAASSTVARQPTSTNK